MFEHVTIWRGSTVLDHTNVTFDVSGKNVQSTRDRGTLRLIWSNWLTTKNANFFRRAPSARGENFEILTSEMMISYWKSIIWECKIPKIPRLRRKYHECPYRNTRCTSKKFWLPSHLGDTADRLRITPSPIQRPCKTKIIVTISPWCKVSREYHRQKSKDRALSAVWRNRHSTTHREYYQQKSKDRALSAVWRNRHSTTHREYHRQKSKDLALVPVLGNRYSTTHRKYHVNR